MWKIADAYGLNRDFRILVNPTGRFVTGGSFADSGVTGRKIIADTYGGAAHHGGGAFSGKDPTKVDRSAAYMARRIAKDVIRAGLAHKCEIQLSYAIGVEEPVGIYVNTFHTGKAPAGYIVKWIRKRYDLTPEGMIDFLGLRNVDYNYTSSLGHFWRQWLPWEDESRPYGK
jgi:S-adenosylmethionine synthetase